MQLSKKVMAIAPSLTLKIDALSKEMKAQGKDVIGFGAGEPDFDTPEYIKLAAKDALDAGQTKYTPASGIVSLKQAVCKRYERKYGLKFDANQVVVSNGAKHSLFNVMQSILNPGDEVIIIAPYWLTYPELVKMADGVPVFVEAKEENAFHPTVDLIAKAVTPKTRAIIINSPSNPCGCVYSKDVLKGIAELAINNDFIVVSDEIYDELDYTENVSSIASVSEEAKAHTVIVNGMSKAYAMTGWRIGYTISSPELAKAMDAYQSQATSNPCSIAQYASVAALNAENGAAEQLEKMVAVFEHRSRLMSKLINSTNLLKCIQPEGAFYSLVNISKCIGKRLDGEVIDGSIKFAELLLKKKLTAVVPGIAFGADNYVRMSYAVSEENIRNGIERIAEFCDMLED